MGCLRQCRSDFSLERIRAVIQHINNTVLVVEFLHECPLAFTRSFCAFEVYSTFERSMRAGNMGLSKITTTLTSGEPSTGTACQLFRKPSDDVLVDLQTA